MEIKKEIPSGIINGSNTVFTLLNVPSLIDDLWIDGAIYTSFSVSENIITLTDAPTLSIFVDYATGSTFIPDTTDITFGDIKAEVWSLLGQKSTSTNFSDTRVGQKINTVMRNVCRGRVTSLIDTNRIYRAGNLWFIKGNFPIRIKAGSTLTEPYNVGDTVITCATTEVLGSGYVEIGGEVIKYTGISSTQLTGVSGAEINHLATEKVIQLYETPVDFEKPQKVSFFTTGSVGRSVEVPLDDDNTKRSYYQILRTGTKQLFMFVGIPSDGLIRVDYTKHISNMGDNTDVNPLPDEYGLSVIANLVAGEFAFQTGMPNGQQILMDGYDNLQNMYQFFTNTTNVIKQSIKPIPYGRISYNYRNNG